MSRINGHYRLGENTHITEVRTLETRTGELFDAEGKKCHGGFTQNTDGTWSNGGYTWVPDAALAADWYVICLEPFTTTAYPKAAPSYSTFGPYTEAEARKNAELRSRKGAGRNGERGPRPYAVVQVQAGNTVLVQPPAPPQPVTVWS